MLRCSPRPKSVLILNIDCFLTFLVRKCPHILIGQKKDKNLISWNFWPNLRIADNFDQTRSCLLFRGLTVLMKVPIINFYPQPIFISVCNILWLSDSYLLMLMLKVSLSLVYHMLSVTYVNFLQISYCKSLVTLRVC